MFSSWRIIFWWIKYLILVMCGGVGVGKWVVFIKSSVTAFVSVIQSSLKHMCFFYGSIVPHSLSHGWTRACFQWTRLVWHIWPGNCAFFTPTEWMQLASARAQLLVWIIQFNRKYTSTTLYNINIFCPTWQMSQISSHSTVMLQFLLHCKFAIFYSSSILTVLPATNVIFI